jgi:glycerol-3-phosphate acyltransferase PlsY
MILILLAGFAFLLGSIPSGLVVTYLTTGRDIRQHGSGNIGASNVGSAAGLPAGIAVGVMDILKGLVPVLIARGAGVDSIGLALVAGAAVLGHDFSVFLRFRGGKGVATTFGVALPLAPIAAVFSMAIWVGVAALSRYASLASLVALAALPVLFAATRQPPACIWLGAGLFLLAAAKHWENIGRLLSGRERRMGDGT